MKKISKYFLVASLATTLGLTSLLSCQLTPQHSLTQPTPQVSHHSINLNTTHGSIRLNVELPVPKAYEAMRRYHGFGIKHLETTRINKLKVTVTNVGTDFKAEKTLPLQQGGLTAQISVPLGNGYIIAVQGMDDLNEVSGAVVKGVFSLASATTVLDVDVNPLSTALAEIVERVKASDKTLAAGLNDKRVESLRNLIKEAKSAASPFLINFDGFSKAIIDNKGEIPLIVPASPVLASGKIVGKITGLEPGDAAVVFSNDPVSRPFIVVAPPLVAASDAAAATTDSTSEELTFKLDNIPPGDWVVRAVSSGYRVEGDTAENTGSIEEFLNTKTAEVVSAETAEIDFKFQKVGWSSTPINASGNIGSSDQPDAEVDGSDNVHLVWRQDGFQDENSGAILYSRWNGQTWTTDRRFVSQAGQENFKGARNPAVAVGVDRSPHVVWSANNDNASLTGRRIVFSRFDGIDWTKSQIISTASGNDIQADNPDVAVNVIDGSIFAVWQQKTSNNTEIYLSRYDGKSWSEPRRLSDSGVSAIAPRIAMGTDGIVHVSWGVEEQQRTQYVNWDGKSETITVEDIPFNEIGGLNSSKNLDMRVDLLNRAHVIWRNGNTLQYILRSNNTWSLPENVHVMNSQNLSVLSGGSLFIDNVGNVNTVWASEFSSSPVIRFRRRTNVGWEQPATAAVDPSASPTPTPTGFPTPTPDPGTSPSSAPSPSPTATIFPGFEDLPLSQNSVPAGKALVVVDSRGVISALWSNSSSNSVDSDIYHSRKATPVAEDN